MLAEWGQAEWGQDVSFLRKQQCPGELRNNRQPPSPGQRAAPWRSRLWPASPALVSHSRESGNPVVFFWIPAFAGMTPAGSLLAQG
jgi:hypothetical protein